MYTWGYKAWRFRKRYYVLHNDKDSRVVKDNLARRMICKIPSFHEAYTTWLDAQRKKLVESKICWGDHLSIRSKNLDSKIYKSSYLEDLNDVKSTWFVSLIDFFIEWVFIVDLNHEILSINNSMHFKLNDISRADKLLLPEPSAEKVVTHIVGGSSTTNDQAINDTRQLVIQEVSW